MHVITLGLKSCDGFPVLNYICLGGLTEDSFAATFGF